MQMWALYLTLAVLCLAGFAYLMTEIILCDAGEKIPPQVL